MFVKYLDRESRLFCEMNPEKAGWTLTNRLLAQVVYALQLLWWSKTKDGAKGRKRPELIGPDGLHKNRRPGSNVKAAPLSRIKALFGREDADKSKKLHNVFGR
ncbi:hypothetical protein BKG82_23190 [Mycobacteroides chelonae]|uniref:Uncharacterized protein n=2 Tax=Mycobacteroides chelonae TaxID=1774 RepID=A0A1S1LFN5_MYCCH|nr:hypothetical protein BKG82_23190 [Mycobacteroides chelonae]